MPTAEKCPHYDPVTRDTVVIGKGCPDYNTPQGCRFAHPFQDTWEVESPFTKDLTNRSRSRSATLANDPPAKTLQNGFAAGGSANGTSKSVVDAMDVDPPSSTHSMSQQPGNPPPSVGFDDTEEYYPSNEPSIDLDPVEIEAVVDFLCDIIEAMRANSRKAQAQTNLDNYKRNYHAYSKIEKRNLTEIVGKSATESWVNDRRVKMEVVKVNEDSLQKWIGKLVELDEPHPPDTTLDGQAEDKMEITREQADSAAVSDAPHPPSPQTAKRTELGEAFHRRRRRFREGWLSERLDDTRATIEGIRHRFEERKALEAADKDSNQPRLLITAGEDVEMQESGQQQAVQQTPEERFLVLRKRLEFIIEQIDQADIWGNMLEEDSEAKFEQAVDSIVERFIQEEMAANPAPASEEEQSVASVVDNSLSLKSILDIYNDIGDIKCVSEAFLKIGSRAPMVDPQIQVQIDQINRGIASLEASTDHLKQGVDQLAKYQAARPTSMPDPELEPLARKAYADQFDILNIIPEIQSVFSSYIVDENEWVNSRPQLRPIPSQEILDREVEAWNREFDETQRQCLMMIQPLVERSEIQKKELEEAARRRKEQTTLGTQNTTSMGTTS